MRNYIKTITIVSNNEWKAGEARYIRRQSFFFFDDDSTPETVDAIAKAMKVGGRLSVWRELLNYPSIAAITGFMPYDYASSVGTGQ